MIVETSIQWTIVIAWTFVGWILGMATIIIYYFIVASENGTSIKEEITKDIANETINRIKKKSNN